MNFEALNLDLMAVTARAVFAHKPNVEDAAVVRVGEVYLVPVVSTRNDSKWRGLRIPVLGDGSTHDDSEFLQVGDTSNPSAGFVVSPTMEDQRHVHIDWRFIPASVYPTVLKTMTDGAGFAGYNAGTPGLELAAVIPEIALEGKPQRYPLICERPHATWTAIPSWLAHMEQVYKDKKVCNNKCPHKGFSLTGCPEDEYGTRTCVGHGLRWSREGCLVPRVLKQQS